MSHATLDSAVNAVMRRTRQEIRKRAYKVSTEMKLHAMELLTGPRSGRVYGGHTASAPGEPPAEHTGKLRRNWMRETKNQGDMQFNASIKSLTGYAAFLDPGTRYIAQRPYRDKIKEMSVKTAVGILSKDYK